MTAPNSVITLSGNGIATPVVIGGGARIAFIAGPCQLKAVSTPWRWPMH